MRNREYFKDRKVTIVGLARSGVSCARLLAKLGAKVSVTDSQNAPATRAKRRQLHSKNIKVELGRHSLDFIKGRDLVVVSPGVPQNAPILAWARKSGIPVLSEIEVGWILCPGRVIAVTGSNGKTTVATLIGRVLKKAGKRVVVCGNIGNSFCREVEKIREGDFVSLEVSSFQLETVRDFKPDIAVILNLSRNHLDRHVDMQEYLAAKKLIFKNQDKDDFLVINKDDPVLKKAALDTESRVVYFRACKKLNANQAAVMAVGSILGVKKNIILKVFKDFKGIEHRMEEVKEIKGIKFINDSKSTTVGATAWALNNIKSAAILIAGGREKGNDYSIIRSLVGRKVKEVVLIGEAREKIAKAFHGVIPIHKTASLKDAVNLAFRRSSKNECVLFSPMCKSFDMFANYEERGRLFKSVVRRLAKDY